MAPQDDGSHPQVAPLSGTVSSPSPSRSPSGGDAPPGLPTAPAPVSSARDVLRTLETAFGKLVTLKIVTVVGDVSVTGSGGDTVVTARAEASVEAASTEINLLDGHIANIFSQGFAGSGGGTLQAFHQSQIEKSASIMVANLAELQKLASALATMRR